MKFVLHIEVERDVDVGGDERWKSLRYHITNALWKEGFRVKKLRTNIVPDPYSFEDPDNLPEGVR